MAIADTVLSNPLVVNIILPFLLIFTVIFALLQKTKILGEGKRQIDAIVALVIGLIVVSFSFATNIIVSLVPVLAVSAIVILVFMVIYGMAHVGGGEFRLPKGALGIIAVLAAIVVVVAVLVSTGAWNYLAELFYSEDGSGIITNVIVLVVIIAVIGAVVFIPGAGKSNKENKL